MRLNIVKKRAIPDGPYTTGLFELPIAAIPYVEWAIDLKSQKYFAIDDENWHKLRNLLNLFGRGLLVEIGATLHNDLSSLYSMLDARIGGQTRDVTGGSGTLADPWVFDPAIPLTIDPNNFGAPGIQRALEYLNRLLENSQHGITNAEFSDNRNYRDLLQAIKTALEATNGSGDNFIQILTAILGAL